VACRKRLNLPHCRLDETINFITQFAQIRPIELAFTLGEVDICEWYYHQSENV
jgi:hypothetical protein